MEVPRSRQKLINTMNFQLTNHTTTKTLNHNNQQPNLS